MYHPILPAIQEFWNKRRSSYTFLDNVTVCEVTAEFDTKHYEEAYIRETRTDFHKSCHSMISSFDKGFRTDISFCTSLRLTDYNHEYAPEYWDYILGEQSPWRLAFKDHKPEYITNAMGTIVAVRLPCVDDINPQVLLGLMVATRYPYEKKNNFEVYKQLRMRGVSIVDAIIISHRFHVDNECVVETSTGHWHSAIDTSKTLSYKAFTSGIPTRIREGRFKTNSNGSGCSDLFTATDDLFNIKGITEKKVLPTVFQGLLAKRAATCVARNSVIQRFTIDSIVDFFSQNTDWKNT